MNMFKDLILSHFRQEDGVHRIESRGFSLSIKTNKIGSFYFETSSKDTVLEVTFPDENLIALTNTSDHGVYTTLIPLDEIRAVVIGWTKITEEEDNEPQTAFTF